MSFLLKIVEGPNKGAEIALVEGVSITLGKADECDIVLADPTLPDAPFTLVATASGVTLDGSALEPLHVKTVGSTAFAVGPADAVWGDLVRERAPEAGEGEKGGDAGHETPAEGPGEEAPAPEESSPAPEPEPEASPKRRFGCLGCLLVLLVLLLILACLFWFFRARLLPKAESVWGRLTGRTVTLAAEDEGRQDGGAPSQGAAEKVSSGLSAIAAKYGLSLAKTDGRERLFGNLRTRAERLAATAEAYAEQPGVDLDLSDDESFWTAAADALFTLTEGELKVVSATNRVLSIVGVSPSANALKKTLQALNDDVPRLRNVDVSGVKFNGPGVAPARLSQAGSSAARPDARPAGRAARAASREPPPEPNFPVCGILTAPYPCLVMKDGTRIFEGATIGDSTILKITGDSVVVTNANGRFTWKP